ncbi:hypothetical protein P154DRAFT_473642 [Amniculicola lignicola CBS 123094]|uniref:Uncharacterized protein n=1 Tax=Amniculicola lignicola CBS 123094 TaxID=1392246 RepID=A0A6A5W4Z6_9PLEO|nr:hypothetical protein P154DRAFT_473642 [Amniculicola lignicola CBS 123094]
MPPTVSNVDPELHYIAPTPHVPNSKLPVLIYRKVLSGWSHNDLIDLMNKNGWKKSGQWKTYKEAHFHTNIQECYVVISGSTLYSLGKSPIDPEKNEEGNENGIKVTLNEGDCFMLPAGVSHCSIESEGDYEHMGFVVNDAPQWDMNFCKDDSEMTRIKAKACAELPIPTTDPVYGAGGALPKIWREIEGR